MIVITLMFGTVILAILNVLNFIRSPIPASPEKWIYTVGTMQVESMFMFTVLACYTISNLIQMYQRKQYTHSWAIIIILLGFNIDGLLRANNDKLWNPLTGTATDTDISWMMFINIMNGLVIGLDLVKVYTSSPEPDKLVMNENEVVKTVRKTPKSSPVKKRRYS